MSRIFNEDEQEMLISLACSVKEEFYEMRKGVAQTFYVFEIKEGSTYCSHAHNYSERTVAEEYVGFWKMDYADNLQYSCLRGCIIGEAWVRCYKKEITTYTWEEF